MVHLDAKATLACISERKELLSLPIRIPVSCRCLNRVYYISGRHSRLCLGSTVVYFIRPTWIINSDLVMPIYVDTYFDYILI
jgi:hypothetical protein